MIAVLTTEVHTDVADRWFRARASERLAISRWVGVEVGSALAMKVRRGVLSDAERRSALAHWATLSAGLALLPIDPGTYDAAASHVDTGPRGLRASDALHLAIAEQQGCSMATLDDDLAASASAIGMVVAAIRES